MDKALAQKITTSMRDVPAVKVDQCKILHISDLHIPFQAQEVVDYVIDKYADPDNTVLVINGEIFDSEYLSSFAYKSHTLMEEVLQANQFIEEASKKFQHVFIMDGDYVRSLKSEVGRNAGCFVFPFPTTLNYYLSRKLHKGMNGLLEPGDPIPNVTYVPDIFFQINNILFSYQTNYSLIPGYTIRKVIEAAMNNFVEFDVAVTGHIYEVQTMKYLGKIGIESGCLSQYCDNYTKTDKEFQLGYATLEIKSGVCVDYNVDNLTHKAKIIVRGQNIG